MSETTPRSQDGEGYSNSFGRDGVSHQETMNITTEGPEFEILSHYMKEVVASVKTEGQSQPVKTKKND
jgi:hypothetical protein